MTHLAIDITSCYLYSSFMTAIDIIYDCIWIACNHINSTIYKQDISPDVSSVFVFHDPINFLVGEASKRLKLKTQPEQNGTLSTCSSYVPLLVYIRTYIPRHRVQFRPVFMCMSTSLAPCTPGLSASLSTSIPYP